MCESIFTHLLKKEKIGDISVYSLGTSSEELGNPVHRGTREALAKHGIKTVDHRADVLTRRDLNEYDLFVCMDSQNVRSCARILGDSAKVVKLTEFLGRNDDVADPWYTGNFEATFEDCYAGCVALLEYLKERR